MITFNPFTGKFDFIRGREPIYARKDSDPDLYYWGFEDTDSRWKIVKVDGTAFYYVTGTSGYSTNWAGRTGLTYTLCPT